MQCTTPTVDTLLAQLSTLQKIVYCLKVKVDQLTIICQSSILDTMEGKIQFVVGDPDSLITELETADPPMEEGDTVYIIKDCVVDNSVIPFENGSRIPEGGPDFHISSIVYEEDETTITFSEAPPPGTYINLDYKTKITV